MSNILLKGLEGVQFNYLLELLVILGIYWADVTQINNYFFTDFKCTEWNKCEKVCLPLKIKIILKSQYDRKTSNAIYVTFVWIIVRRKQFKLKLKYRWDSSLLKTEDTFIHCHYKRYHQAKMIIKYIEWNLFTKYAVSLP